MTFGFHGADEQQKNYEFVRIIRLMNRESSARCVFIYINVKMKTLLNHGANGISIINPFKKREFITCSIFC